MAERAEWPEPDRESVALAVMLLRDDAKQMLACREPDCASAAQHAEDARRTFDVASYLADRFDVCLDCGHEREGGGHAG